MGDDVMPKRLPDHCIEDRDRHGNVRIYLRRPGIRKVRLHGVPWTEPFMEAYRTALDAPPPPAAGGMRGPAKPGTWRWLCEAYFEAPEIREGLEARTRSVRRSLLEATFVEPTKPGASTLYADFPLSKMTPTAIRVLRDRRADKREAANGRLKAIRQVFVYGIEKKGLLSNPARDVPYLGGRGDGFHTWSIEEVQQYGRRHPLGSKAWLALALLLFVGCRRSDVVALGRQNIRNGSLRYTQHKNRKRNPVTLDLPVLPALQAAIDAMPVEDRTGRPSSMTFLATQFGKPFTSNGFGNWFKDRCVEAGLLICTAHGLRKAGATLAAENGATEAQLMGIYGWTNPKQAAVYTKKARQKVLAGTAMHLINLDENGTAVVPPFRRVEVPPGKNRSKTIA